MSFFYDAAGVEGVKRPGQEVAMEEWGGTHGIQKRKAVLYYATRDAYPRRDAD
ncbi:hypothetical protein NMG29_25850 [Streptomyces cocklensis]|uniref:Uncharacterized protein n=1 Tax=Actinacidiphila cocklensis TaxID=887465 RepID=A0A9W4GQ62_9ACTN|nr:hypothetical protein [Actinacidiphila cocklensis]MDD1061599.1 hypothetical protein [Actinacidiphila cocklensis]CAG6392339.1 hypothetical protein SCOCK_160121 [Actinacidiphila cocklensis]